MIISEQKSALYKLAIGAGIGRAEELRGYKLPDGPAGEARMSSWMRKFLQQPKEFAEGRRYVNRFKLGADPEFCFAQPGGQHRIDAQALRLAQGPAFGADNNGRLAEIRPYPSRSAVEVCASILTTLRWMAVLAPGTVSCEWHAGAFLWDDGVGGHVHFGRKRPTRKQEVAALDAIEEGLLALGVYPQDQVLRRRAGDARRQLYGQLGDFRLQTHGYEYRTYPSWLDSPELAFLTLVVSKLAVQMPGLYTFKGVSGEIGEQRLKNFLSYFKCVDDDARLALMMLGRGLPRHIGGDFKLRWGIDPSKVTKAVETKVVPLSIKPDQESVREIFSYLQEARPLLFRMPARTWSPGTLPMGYEMCIKQAHTILQKGLGEMIWDLCTWKQEVVFSGGRQGMTPIQFSRGHVQNMPADWKDRFEGLARCNEDLARQEVKIAPEWREGARAKRIKKLLLNGLLPIWKAKDCKSSSYDDWLKKNQQRSSKFAGSVVWESCKNPALG